MAAPRARGAECGLARGGFAAAASGPANAALRLCPYSRCAGIRERYCMGGMLEREQLLLVRSVWLALVRVLLKVT